MLLVFLLFCFVIGLLAETPCISYLYDSVSFMGSCRAQNSREAYSFWSAMTENVLVLDEVDVPHYMIRISAVYKLCRVLGR